MTNESRCCDFPLEILHCHAGVYNSGPSTVDGSSLEKLLWDKMSLVPVSVEVTSRQQWALKSLPSVKKKGIYGYVDEYLDTYYTLLREECFAYLRKGLADLKANKLDPRDMKVCTHG
ncbi:hypothetical protein SUGI_0332690 [Cryptomeria japonica]|nr:hypothetical protein SUGI_0332690 [Cryptomeria japonica]